MEQIEESETPNHKLLMQSSSSSSFQEFGSEKDEGKRLAAKFMKQNNDIVSGTNLKVLEESRKLIERTNQMLNKLNSKN